MSSKEPPRRLGRGLSSLISSDLQPPREQVALRMATDPVPGPRLMELPLDQISPNPLQPRKLFDDRSIGQLAASIRERGTLQPVIVRPAPNGFQLVAGERRWRAARMAGATHIPAIVRYTTDGDALELALIENLHREDLNPVERAEAYLEIKKRVNISNDELADRLGEDRSTVANYLRVLDLPQDALDMLADGRLSMGHGRAILGVADPRLRSTLARTAADEGWSVRQTEARVRAIAEGAARRVTKVRRATVSDVERRLTEAIGTRVSIIEGRKKGTGRIVIEYYSLDDFERIADRLGMERET